MVRLPVELVEPEESRQELGQAREIRAQVELELVLMGLSLKARPEQDLIQAELRELEANWDLQRQAVYLDYSVYLDC